MEILITVRTGNTDNRTGHNPGTPARMATGGSRRNGHIPECRRIEAATGAECGQLGAET